MTQFYAEIRFVHIAAVLASGVLFFLRGLALAVESPWVRAAPIRYVSYTIDTILLTAALMLMTIVQQYPFVHGWLTAKVVLLVLYIGFGMAAFWSGRDSESQLRYWAAGLVVYAFIVSIARAHDPLGILSSLAAP